MNIVVKTATAVNPMTLTWVGYVSSLGEVTDSCSYLLTYLLHGAESFLRS
jgi:hypothetical protein